MKTSLSEIQNIEAYLQGHMSTEDALVFEARILTDADLAERVAWQKQTYALVKQYARQQTRREIERVQQQLLSAPEHNAFRRRILGLFSKR